MAKMIVPVVLDNGASPFPAVEVAWPDQEFFRTIVAHQDIYHRSGSRPVDQPATDTAPATYRDLTLGETALLMIQGWVNGAAATRDRWEEDQAAKASKEAIPPTVAPTFTPIA